MTKAEDIEIIYTEHAIEKLAVYYCSLIPAI